jgi:uncharacterized protein (DUF885 family)
MLTTSQRHCAHSVVIAASVMVLACSVARAQTGPSPSQQISALLDTVTRGMRSPGLDFDFSDTARRHLPDPSRRAWERDAERWSWVAQQVRAIPTATLSSEERLTLQLLAWEARANRQKGPFWWVDFATVTPYSSPLGGIARGLSARPLRLSSDTTVYLQMLREVAPMIDSIRTGLEQRAARGIRLSKEALPASVALLRAYAVRGAGNPFAMTTMRASALDSATRDAFLSSTEREVGNAIVPAVDRLVTLLSGSYADAASPAVGLMHYPGGRAYYDWLVRYHTTLPVTAEDVHRIGVAEVARIEGEMAAIRSAVGFTGTRSAFHAQLAKDPRFIAKTPEEFGDRLMSYATRLWPLIPRAFGTLPRARGDVKRLPPELEPAMTFGYYQLPTARDSVGHYFYNGTQLEERSLLTAAPLIAHELWPGHHFQVNLSRENPALPPFRRDRYYTAFGEGWGDYASIVAGELGLYEDPYDRYGRLAMDMFISCRLVVDTGMNGLGWSRERAMAYMRAHVLESETQIRSESLRYSTDLPGQALAYKMGSREFVQLRAGAERALGSRFTVPAYHDMLIGSGSLPMTVVRARVAAWVQGQMGAK